MNKRQLASKIFAAANKLRGKISADEYKDYMLGLIFYKFLSEKEEKYLKDKLYFTDEDIKEVSEEDTEVVENCRNNIGYFISYDNLYSTWISKSTDFQIADVRTALSAFDRLIGPNHKKVFDKIFDTLNTGLESFGTSEGDKTKSVRGLIYLINDIPTENQEYDVLGFIYEYLLKNFAANAGKAGEFYTPHEAATVMSEIIAEHCKNKSEILIYDPTSGSGSLLINVGKSISKQMNDPNKVKYYAQELIEKTYNLTRMNLIMRNVLPDNIVVRNGDTLSDDWPFFDDNDKDRTYDPVFVDACTSNPPYSQTWENKDANNDRRFREYGTAPSSKADYAFLLHNLYHLKNDGIMTIVLPHGVLFRGGEEGKIRKKLVENKNIDAIIGLPSNCFFGTGIPTIIMVLKKNKTDGDILFVDASKGFIKDGNKNKLRARDVRKIVDTVISRKDIDKYSRLVKKEEIVENDYNLNIPRYIDSSEKQELHDIYSIMFGGIPNYEIDELNEYWQAFPSLREDVFVGIDNIPYSNVVDGELKDIIKNNKDVKEFVGKFNDTFVNFPSLLKEELITKALTMHVNKEETTLASVINTLLKDIPLIDYYEAYQILDDQWNIISIDLENIQKDGMDTVKVVDPNMVTKKKSNSKETYEKQEGWKGRILPFELVQEYYFKDEKDKADELREAVASLTQEKENLLDSIDPADKEVLLDEDGEEIVAKKLTKAIAEIKKKVKQGAEFEEDSYEDIIIRINNTNEALKTKKKELKASVESIETKTKEKIENLTNDEIVSMLEEKWIKPLCSSINELTTEKIELLVDKIEYLKDKYLVTLKDTDKQIKENKASLSSMIDELTGSEFDMKGLNEFKKLLGGENNE